MTLQASIYADTGSWDRKRADMKGIRKITPSQPPSSPRSKYKVPPSVAAAASGSSTTPEQQSVKLKLQQAFLEQYSGAGQQVRHSATSLTCVTECAPTMIKASACLCRCRHLKGCLLSCVNSPSCQKIPLYIALRHVRNLSRVTSVTCLIDRIWCRR